MGRHVGIILAVVSLGITACASVEDKLLKAGAKQANTADIVRLVSARTVYGTGSTGRRFTLYFSPIGALRMSAAKGKFRDVGMWRVENSTLCYTWMNVKTGDDCEKVFIMPNGKVVYTTAGGNKGSFDAFGEGNVEKL